MIRSWHGRYAAAIWMRQRPRGLDDRVVDRAQRLLAQLDAAHALSDLRVPPGNRLHKLRGDRVGQYGLRVNEQLRICFRWVQGHAHEVELTDYH